MKRYKVIASLVNLIKKDLDKDNQYVYKNTLEFILDDNIFAPTIDLETVTPSKIIFFFKYDPTQLQTGYFSYSVTLTPSLINDFDLKVEGVNTNECFGYIYQEFENYLREDIDYRME